jgi:hypothetical protein
LDRLFLAIRKLTPKGGSNTRWRLRCEIQLEPVR